MRAVHLDTPMSDEDFVALENDLRESTDDVVAGFRTFAETIFLEGTLSGDRCQGCVHQERNGSRAIELVEAELSKRQWQGHSRPVRQPPSRRRTGREPQTRPRRWTPAGPGKNLEILAPRWCSATSRVPQGVKEHIT